MQKVWLLAMLLILALSARAQEEVPLESLMQSAEQWAKDNLDDDALAVLQNIDQEKVRQFLQDFQKRSQGEYVIDMAQLKDAARALLPLLDSYEETTPYAAWLRAQLDYFDVAEAFRTNLPPVKAKPGETPPPPPNPSPEKERALWITKMVDRPWPKQAKPYIPRLKPVFMAERVPAELVWIAEVESSFDRRARSPEDAAGLFQLRPATAKQYGLRVGLLDQRYNPEASARAAAQHLKYLHNKFHDWRLALAAYNVGEGKLSRLMKQHKAKTFDAVSPYLPAETQMYVPRIEAVLLRREGVKLQEL